MFGIISWYLYDLFETALILACKNGFFKNNLKIVKFLLEQNGIDINAKDVHLFQIIFHSKTSNFNKMFGFY